MKLKISTLLTASALAISFCQSVNATSIIFADNFNRGGNNYDRNGWNETEQSNNDVKLIRTEEDGNNRAYLLQNSPEVGTTTASNPDAAVTRLFDVSAYDHLSLSFNWMGTKTTDKGLSGDFLNLSWRSSTDSAWSNIWRSNLGDQHGALKDLSEDEFKTTLNLSSITASNFYLRFWTDVTNSSSGNEEGAYIDNFKLTGNTRNQSSGQSGVNALAISNVPEPSAIALLGLGVMGWLGFKRKSV